LKKGFTGLTLNFFKPAYLYLNENLEWNWN